MPRSRPVRAIPQEGLTRPQVERMSSSEIETRMTMLMRYHLPAAAFQQYEVLASVQYERVHHEAQLMSIQYAKVFAKHPTFRGRWHRRLMNVRWMRRFGVRERTV